MRSRQVILLISAVSLVFVVYTLFTSNVPELAYDLSRLTEQGSGPSKGAMNYKRENATFVCLARNDDLDNLIGSVRSFEDRFNRDYHYDWVFLNEEPFTNEFKEMMTSLTSGTVHFGQVPKEHWGYPSWIDQEKAAESRKEMEADKVIYASSESYRHMCRYQSGFFFQHPLMLNYRYYWRVEPETRLHCDVGYDVFKYMRENNKSYGWTISITEWERTIRTLWKTTLDFINLHPSYIDADSASEFLSEDGLETYNLCHFWSNFEMADMNFWRGKIYQEYFSFLDQSGGFFYERWGDAPVHSIAAALFMPKDQIHFFDDIGYTHPPFTHCPKQAVSRGLSCDCKASNSFDFHDSSCLTTYMKAKGIETPDKDL